MAQVSFLKFPLSSVRRSIKDIDDSYRNPWDIFAELAQNSVDAIRKMQIQYDEEGVIIVTIDSQKKSIMFEDNGCGISYKELPELLNLFSSGKSDDPGSVGEKGVGLKFVLFQSKEFEIISSDGDTAGRAIIKDARLWKKGTSEEELMLDIEELDSVPRGTKITIRDVELRSDDNEEQGLPLFQLSFEQLKYVLRNKTFLGSTAAIWDSNYRPINIILKYKDFNGNDYEEVLKNEYVLPIEGLTTSDIVDMDDFEEWLSKDRTDTDKRSKLQGKVLVAKGEYLHNNYRKISYWACFLPSRRDWDTLNERLNLIPNGAEIDEEYKENNGYCLCTSGIYTATKGMPTGIAINHPSTGNAGYWPNYFMIFQDDALTFDIGRKSIHGKVQAIYQAKAKEVFSRITKYVVKYTSSVPVTPSSTDGFDRDEIKDEIKELVDLKSNQISFVKNPAEQEASVSAVFFELIGKGVITDLVPIYLGYRNKYDLYAYYVSAQTKKQKFVFCEFKSHLRHLTKDFSEARKVFDELDYVICWDVNDTDIQQLSTFGIGCEEVENGTLHSIDCPNSVTHRLSIPNCNPVYVIDLKRIV